MSIWKEGTLQLKQLYYNIICRIIFENRFNKLSALVVNEGGSGSASFVVYDPDFASLQILGMLSKITPEGRTIITHAADRMTNSHAPKAGSYVRSKSLEVSKFIRVNDKQ